jgi:hypothetical protein
VTDWREELIEKMAKAIAARPQDSEDRWWIWEPEARAALAVAEPVIREQADNALREENARLREALKPFAYIAEHVGEEDARWAVPSAHLRAAAAAIREGGKDGGHS